MNPASIHPQRSVAAIPPRNWFAICPILALLCLAAPPWLTAQAEGGITGRADYRNVLYVETLRPEALVATNVNLATAQRVVDLLRLPEFNTVAFFSGSAALTTNTYPGGGVVRLQRSVIGQPVGGVDHRIPGETFLIGQAIEPATNLNARPGVAPFDISPSGAAVPVDVGGRTNVYAAFEGPVEIRWVGMDGRAISAITYRIEAPRDTTNRVKLYHTHATSGDLYHNTGRIPDPEVCRVIFPPAAVTPVIHWNPRIPFKEETNNPTVRFDRNLGELLARPPAQGYLLFEYRDQNGGFLGVEPVLVKANDPEVGTTPVDIGFPLAPSTPAADAAIPHVSRGFDFNAPYDGYIYQHATNAPSQPGQLWAIRTSTDPRNLEVYWRRTGVAGIIWPYALQRYTAAWPTTPLRYQLYVRGSTTNVGPDVVVPANDATRLLPFMEPVGHAGDGHGGGAGLLSLGRFSTAADGWSLLKFELNNFVSFQVVRSVLHNTGTPAEAQWPIGREITEESHEGPRGGYIHVLETKSPKEDRYHYQMLPAA